MRATLPGSTCCSATSEYLNDSVPVPQHVLLLCAEIHSAWSCCNTMVWSCSPRPRMLQSQATVGGSTLCTVLKPIPRGDACQGSMHAAQRVVFRFQAWALTLNITHSFRYGKDLSNITFAHVEGGGASLEASVGPSLLGDNTAPRAPSTPPLPELEVDPTEAEQEALMSMVEMGLNDVQVRIPAPGSSSNARVGRRGLRSGSRIS